MNNLVLITSVIKPPNSPLSYIATRSIYTCDERFEQTKKTIESIRNNIPNSTIFLIECSQLTKEQLEYFIEKTDIFINIFDTGNTDFIDAIYSKSKSLGEASQTIYALEYIIKNNIEFTHFFKISGRYYLSDKFNFATFENDMNVIKYIDGNRNNCFTALYKLKNIQMIRDFLSFLKQNIMAMMQCIGYEVLVAHFFKNYKDIKYVDPIGLCGPVSVSFEMYDG